MPFPATKKKKKNLKQKKKLNYVKSLFTWNVIYDLQDSAAKFAKTAARAQYSAFA